MNNPNQEPATLDQVKAAADDLLSRVADAEFMASDLFPFGVNRIAVHVKSGDVEVSLEVSGPDHGHTDEDGDALWLDEDDEELFEGPTEH